jgi:hypothetical protein
MISKEMTHHRLAHDLRDLAITRRFIEYTTANRDLTLEESWSTVANEFLTGNLENWELSDLMVLSEILDDWQFSVDSNKKY